MESGYLVSILIDSEIVIAIVDLNIPVVRQARVGAILYPNPPLIVHIAALALLWSFGHRPLFNDCVPKDVRCQFRIERMLPVRWQPRLLHLIDDLLRQAGGHGKLLLHRRFGLHRSHLSYERGHRISRRALSLQRGDPPVASNEFVSAPQPRRSTRSIYPNLAAIAAMRYRQSARQPLGFIGTHPMSDAASNKCPLVYY